LKFDAIFSLVSSTIFLQAVTFPGFRLGGLALPDSVAKRTNDLQALRVIADQRIFTSGL
jgi:hypothetical protein